MPPIYKHNFDEDTYLEHYPEAAELVRSEQLASVYEHMVTTLEPTEHERFRLAVPEATVTVVVPAYNASRWLEHTLQSIHDQTFRAWECIVVDDFSKDDTASITKGFIAKDKRFRLLTHRSNGGLSAARNSGIRSARGTYICFLDSDDLLMATSLANRVRALRTADSDRLVGSYSGSETIDESQLTPPDPSAAPNMKVIDFLTASGMCPFNANQPMFKTAVLRQLGGFDQRLRQAEDWEFWMRILRHGYYFVPTNQTDVTYRTHEQSMVRSNPLHHLDLALTIHEAAHTTLPEEKVYEGAPFVYRKPWINYKKQLDISRRVIEFCGMALSSGQADHEALLAPARSLPDFFGAIVAHRDLAAALHAGVLRQLAASPSDTSRYTSQLFVDKCMAALREAQDDDPGVVIGEFPHALGLVPAEQRTTDVVFLPHKDYHVWSFSLILDALRAAGITYIFVDLGVVYRDEGARRKLEELELPYVSYNEFLLGNYRPKMVVCMNDWDPIVRRIVQSCQRLGIPTVGVVEGVQDYHDVDTGRIRAPYRTVDYVLLPGDFDARYFAGARQRVRVGGVPRIDELLREENEFPHRPLVVINSNFTYNVLTEHRDEWVRQIVAACDKLDYDYIISRHPADQGDFSAYKVASESMYDLVRRGSVFVSRFGSGILESLAMGKPALYFNPHQEKIDKFKEPNGAFPISTSFDELVRDLQATIEAPDRFLTHADAYIQLHCGTSKRAELTATERLAREMLEIYQEVVSPSEERRALLKQLLIHADERLLGPVTIGTGFAERSRRNGTSHRWPLQHGMEQLSLASLQARRDKLQRKLRKLRRDPKAFFEDSRHRPIHLLKRLF